jgi:hypothetical protein
VYYPPEKKSNLGSMILVGGLAAIGIGGALLYLLSRQNGGNGNKVTCWRCSGTTPVSQDFPAGTICGQGAASEYPYSSIPNCGGTLPCAQGINLNCFPGFQGLRRCDRYNNLCECNNGQWNCIEENSQICKNQIKHLDCFYNEENVALCFNTYDWGGDNCEEPLIGCHCDDTISCGTNYFCERYDDKCWPFALNYPINAFLEDMICWEDDGAYYCQYQLPDGIKAASSLTGKFYYKWGPLPCEWCNFAVFGVYKDRVQQLWSEGGLTCGDWGSRDVTATTFPDGTQAIDSLVFACNCPVANIHPYKFIGKISL